jgi:uroporphyrinogen-III decarboxylase
MSEKSEGARLFGERQKRLNDVIALRVPDRVPVVYWSMFWHAAYGGHTIREAMYDYDLASSLFIKAVNDLQPDGVGPAFIINALGPLLDLTGYRQLRWPGHGVGDNNSYQYIDQELMTADEYELFIEDPSYFYLSRYLPRMSEVFAPLARLPQFSSMQYFDLLIATQNFADPEVVQGLSKLAEAGAEAQRMVEHAITHFKQIAAAGFPSIIAGMCPAPFDYFADFLRGSKGIMLDMFRKKDKLLEAMDRAIPILVRHAVALGTSTSCNIIFMPMHWGLDGFMSPAQFKTFFWPQLRRVMMGLIENNIVPCVLWEGDCTSRLETIADIPAGKAIYFFERTDIFRAKEVLGDVVCLRGNVPPSLLNTGTPDEVTAYCRRLIEVVGKNGGFILDGAFGIPDEAPEENVRAMFRSVHEFGRYR